MKSQNQETAMKLVAMMAVAAGCLLSLAGCENTGGKLAVSGSVSLKGEPLNKGTITFLLPEEKTPTAEALIENGKYSLPAVSGLLPGKYRVRISAIEEFVITPEDYAAGKQPPPNRERVPPKYNTDSQEMVEVTKEKNQFDFQIE
jgi:hypothetical protein